MHKVIAIWVGSAAASIIVYEWSGQ